MAFARTLAERRAVKRQHHVVSFQMHPHNPGFHFRNHSLFQVHSEKPIRRRIRTRSFTFFHPFLCHPTFFTAQEIYDKAGDGSTYDGISHWARSTGTDSAGPGRRDRGGGRV